MFVVSHVVGGFFIVWVELLHLLYNNNNNNNNRHYAPCDANTHILKVVYVSMCGYCIVCDSGVLDLLIFSLRF